MRRKNLSIPHLALLHFVGCLFSAPAICNRSSITTLFSSKNPSRSPEVCSFLHFPGLVSSPQPHVAPSAREASRLVAPAPQQSVAAASFSPSSSLHRRPSIRPSKGLPLIESRGAAGGSLARREALSAIHQTPPDFIREPRRMLATGDGAGGEGLHWAPKNPTAALIFMHGLGDTAAGWAELLQVLEAAQLEETTRLVLPTAPVRPVTLNMGMRMNAWSDIRGVTEDASEDKEGLMASKERIDALINQEIKRGIDPSRIVVGGFSQGGAMAYLVGLTSPHRLGGILPLSCWCPLGNEIQVSKHYAQAVPRILHCHGSKDDLVRPIYGQTSVEGIRNRFLDLGAPPDQCQNNISFKSYEGLSHSASQQELSDIGIFLTKIFKKPQ